MKKVTTDSHSPTACIIALAERSPGGVIRWKEAHHEYLSVISDMTIPSRYPRGWPSVSASVAAIMRRHFIPVHRQVEGGTERVQGFYVLRSMAGDDLHRNEDEIEMSRFRARFELDDFGMSVSLRSDPRDSDLDILRDYMARPRASVTIRRMSSVEKGS